MLLDLSNNAILIGDDSQRITYWNKGGLWSELPNNSIATIAGAVNSFTHAKMEVVRPYHGYPLHLLSLGFEIRKRRGAPASTRDPPYPPIMDSNGPGHLESSIGSWGPSQLEVALAEDCATQKILCSDGRKWHVFSFWGQHFSETLLLLGDKDRQFRIAL